MHYSVIRPYDIANGPGVRVSLFVSGCRNKCPGCFNPETWSFTYGQEFTWETLHYIEEMLKKPHVKGLSILGGDPFEPENIQWVEILCAYVKRNCPDRDIWLWTGYDFLDFIDYPIVNYLDVVVDGRYEADKKDLTLSYRGSWNQRVIDVQKSIKARCAVRLAGDWR